MYKIIFFGSSDYCIPLLESLAANFKVVGVVTKSPDNPVDLYSAKNGINVFTPNNKLELVNLRTVFLDLKPDLFVVADFGLIIPASVFTLPKHETINIHFSHLPKLRGASPVQHTILAGLQSTWVSVIKMAETVDSGEILKMVEFQDINPGRETAKSLYTKSFKKISLLLPEIINDYVSGKIKLAVQKEDQATFAPRLTRDDGFLPFELFRNAINGQQMKKQSIRSLLIDAAVESSSLTDTLERAVRAFDPWPGVWTEVQFAKNKKKRLKILEANIKEGKLMPVKIQLEGKNPVSWDQFLEGYPDIAGQFNL